MFVWRSLRAHLDRYPDLKELPLYEQQWLIAQARTHALKDLGFALTTTILGISVSVWVRAEFPFPLPALGCFALLLFISWLFIRAARRRIFEAKLQEKLDATRRSVVWAEGDPDEEAPPE